VAATSERAKLSWVESYGLSTRRYLILRSQGEYDYNSRQIQVRSISAVAEEVDGAAFTLQEPIHVSHTFRRLCEEQSEEYRRSTFYASFEFVARDSWHKVEELLRLLVIDSMKNPSMLWSHDRCIAWSIDALVRQEKHDQA
jgi:hypothetical protein